MLLRVAELEVHMQFIAKFCVPVQCTSLTHPNILSLGSTVWICNEIVSCDQPTCLEIKIFCSLLSNFSPVGQSLEDDVYNFHYSSYCRRIQTLFLLIGKIVACCTQDYISTLMHAYAVSCHHMQSMSCYRRFRCVLLYPESV